MALITACGGSRSSTDTQTGVPKALEGYRENHQIERYQRYQMAGLQLWRVTVVGAHDLSSSSVVGVDGQGRLLRGWELFQRVGDLPAAERAARVLDMIFAKAPGGALEPEPPKEGDFFPADQISAVEAPSIVGSRLIFWTVVGEMAPTLTRVSFDLTTGKSERTSARDVLHPPPDPLPPIRSKLASEDPAVVVEGLVLVSEYCALAPEVAALLKHPAHTVRSTALDILSNLGDPRFVPDIITLLREGPEWGDRSRAGATLLRFPKQPEALAALKQHLATARGQEVSVLRGAMEYERKHPTSSGRRPCEP